MVASRDDNWKAQYVKLAEFREAHGTTKIPRTVRSDMGDVESSA